MPTANDMGGPAGPPDSPQGASDMISKFLAILEQIVGGMPPDVLKTFSDKVEEILQNAGAEGEGPEQGQPSNVPPEQQGNPNVKPMIGAGGR